MAVVTTEQEFNIVSGLIARFNLSVNEIKSYMGVSLSTIYRWLEQRDEQMSVGHYKKLLALYCRYYLATRRTYLP